MQKGLIFCCNVHRPQSSPVYLSFIVANANGRLQILVFKCGSQMTNGRGRSGEGNYFFFFFVRLFYLYRGKNAVLKYVRSYLHWFGYRN